jgi:hypothetical protein
MDSTTASGVGSTWSAGVTLALERDDEQILGCEQLRG